MNPGTICTLHPLLSLDFSDVIAIVIRFETEIHYPHTHIATASYTCTGVSWGLLAVLHFPLDMLKQYTRARGAWKRARLVSSILGHKCGLCRRTAGPFKTGLSLIGHTSVAPSQLLASQLIREAEQSWSLTSQSALNLSYSKQDILFLKKKRVVLLHQC